MQKTAVLVITAIALAVAAPSAALAKNTMPSKKPPTTKNLSVAPVYEASAPSAYCMEHPSQCKDRDPDARPIQGPYEHCVDVYGNGDGYASQWEIGNFGERCR